MNIIVIVIVVVLIVAFLGAVAEAAEKDARRRAVRRHAAAVDQVTGHLHAARSVSAAGMTGNADSPAHANYVAAFFRRQSQLAGVSAAMMAPRNKREAKRALDGWDGYNRQPFPAPPAGSADLQTLANLRANGDKHLAELAEALRDRVKRDAFGDKVA